MKLGLYRHYKGGIYKVIGTCLHSESYDELVLYESLNANPKSKFWVRPIQLFLDKVEVNGEKIERFKFIGNQKSKQRL